MSPRPPDVARRLTGLRPLADLLAPVRRHLVACALLSATAAAAGLAPYVAVAEVARAALAPGGLDDGTAWAWVVVGAAGGCVRLLLVYASSQVGHRADATVLHHIRVRLLDRMGVLPLGWFRTVGSGRVKKVMTADLEEMHLVIAHALGQLVGAVVVMAIGLAYLALVDLRMAAATVAVLAVVLVTFQVAMRSTSEHMGRLLDAEGRIAAASVEYADGIAVVKAFGTGGSILDRFDRAVDDHGTALGRWAAETRWSTALSRISGSEVTVLGVVLAVGLALVAAGSMEPRDLLPALVVGVGLPTSIMPMVNGAQGVRKGRVAAGNVLAVLDRPGLPAPVTAGHPDGSRIEVDHVSFAYGDDGPLVLDDVSLVLEPGTVTALVGPSGAGKSTLASLVPRFADVTSGSIRIGGVDVRDIPPTTLLSSTSLVFQDVALLREPVRDNVRLGRPDAPDEAVEAACRAAHVHDVVQAMAAGYDTVLGTGDDLSGGERQRLTIARAILSDAPIVVLDEATASLDPDSEAVVQAGLAALVRGRTVLVIAHRLHTVAGADQIAVLDGGRLVEVGRHDDLLARDGLYARMWRAQESLAQVGAGR